MSKAYARRAWKSFGGIGEDVPYLPTLDEQDAPAAEVENVFAARPAAAAVPAVDVNALVAVDEDDDWKLGVFVGLDEAERVGVK